MSAIKKIALFCLLVSSFYSCSQMINGVLFPNQCKRCELFDTSTNEVLFVLQGCGSKNTDIESKCKEEAWELSRVGNACNIDMRCDSWRKEKE